MFRSRQSKPSEAQELRRKQVDSLKDMVPSAKSVVPDGTMWDVLVHSQKYGQLSFRIVLPPTFPERPPEFKLLVQATHPWVTQDLSIVGAPRLAGWGVRTSLGAVALEIAEEFSRNPPEPIRNPAHHQQQQNGQHPVHRHGSPAVSASGSSGSVQSQSHGNGNGGANANAKPAREVPKSFDELDRFNTTQLEELLVNHEQFRDLLMSLACVESVKMEQAKLVSSIESVAQRNLSFKEEMEKVRAELETARAEYAAMRAEYDELLKRQQAVSQKYSVKATLDALREAASKSDAESETLVDRFRDGDMEHAEFVKEYLRSRATYHGRAAKLERIKYQIRC